MFFRKTNALLILQTTIIFLNPKASGFLLSKSEVKIYLWYSKHSGIYVEVPPEWQWQIIESTLVKPLTLAAHVRYLTVNPIFMYLHLNTPIQIDSRGNLSSLNFKKIYYWLKQFTEIVKNFDDYQARRTSMTL